VEPAGQGFVDGVAAHPGHRGRGHAAEVCGFVLRELLAEHGRAALLVDAWNAPAIALYRRLGLRGQPPATVPVRPEFRARVAPHTPQGYKEVTAR